MIGDSTMTQYALNRRPQMGWGEAMPLFFDGRIIVDNAAKGGRSSRSFYNEKIRWPTVKKQIKKGDYVLIQFAHNDQKLGSRYAAYGTYAYCSDGTTNGETCLDPDHSYYQYLKKYVQETRQLGGIPILTTPIVRGYFQNDKITPKGQHNLTKVNKDETYPRGNYTQAMKDVAKKYSVPLLDITKDTETIVEYYGPISARKYLYIPADSTHPRVLYATLIAKATTDDLKALNILSNHIVDSEKLVVSPATLDWGKRYLKVATTKRLIVSAFGLKPESGTVTLKAPQGFTLASGNSAKQWADTYTITYTHGAFTQLVAVKFTAKKQQQYHADLIFTLANKKLGEVGLKATGVDAVTGIVSYASWLDTPTTKKPDIEGLVTATDVKVVNLKSGSKKILAVDGQDTTVARFAVVGPDMVTRSDDRYLQFTITSANKTFNVSEISAYLASSGGSTVQADVEYSLDKNFSNPVKLNVIAPLSFAKNTMTKETFEVSETLNKGSTLYVRIFPWNRAGNTGKYLAVYDLTIRGISGQ